MTHFYRHKSLFERLKFLLLGFILFSFVSLAFANSTLQENTNSLLQYTHQSLMRKKFNKMHYIALEKILQKRQALILETLKTPSSKKIIPYLLPKKITQMLPREFQKYVEQEISLTGTLEIRSAIHFNGHEELQYVLYVKDIPHQLFFADGAPTNLQTGDQVKLNPAYQIGMQQDLIVLATDLHIIKSPKAIPTAFGPQKTIIVAVNFQDKPTEQPWNLDAIKAVLKQVNDQYYESSYNQTTVVGDAIGWYTLAVNSTDDCNTTVNKMGALVQEAATKAGIDLTPYKRRMYAFPKNAGCSWAGLGTVGIRGNYSEAWLNGVMNIRTTGHELGHNLGLFHSRYVKCAPGSVEEGTCSLIEYGDGVDIMGGSPQAHFNAFQKDRLGWLGYQASPPIKTVTTSGNYVIDAYETKNNNVKALKVLKQTLANGSSDYYYLEFRQPIGFDSILGCSACDYTKGVVIHRGNSVNGNSSDVLDMTPDGVGAQMSLTPGKSYENPKAANGGVTFKVNSVSTAGANVTVTFGSTPPPPVCTRAAHSITINPATTQWVKAGAIASYQVTVKNNDTTACTASNFYVTTSVPNDLILTALNSQWLSLAPGAEKTLTLSVTSKPTITTGIYSIGVTATNTTTPGIHASVIANLGINP